MNSKVFVMLGLAIVALASCSKPSSEPQPTPSATVLTDEALDAAPIPVKEDFEEQAQQAINEDNLDEQLNKLEKEIESDK